MGWGPLAGVTGLPEALVAALIRAAERCSAAVRAAVKELKVVGLAVQNLSEKARRSFERHRNDMGLTASADPAGLAGSVVDQVLLFARVGRVYGDQLEINEVLGSPVRFLAATDVQRSLEEWDAVVIPNAAEIRAGLEMIISQN